MLDQRLSCNDMILSIVRQNVKTACVFGIHDRYSVVRCLNNIDGEDLRWGSWGRVF
jgi:hypothetical protein